MSVTPPNPGCALARRRLGNVSKNGANERLAMLLGSLGRNGSGESGFVAASIQSVWSNPKMGISGAVRRRVDISGGGNVYPSARS